MGRSMVALVTCLAVALAGCQVSTAPKTVVTVREPQGPTMIRAPWNGEYTLYIVPADGSGKSVVQPTHLKKGDPLGFRRRESGIVAVAADWEEAIGRGSYAWVMKPDPGQTDPVATAIVIAVVVVAVSAAAIVIWTVIDFHNKFGGTRDVNGVPGL